MENKNKTFTIGCLAAMAEGRARAGVKFSDHGAACHGATASASHGP